MKNLRYLLFLIVFLSSFGALFGQNAQEYFDIDYKYDLNKDYKSAIIHYTKAIKLNPNLENVFFNRACAKEDSNDIYGGFL